MSDYTDNPIRFRHVDGIRFELTQQITWRIGHIDGPRYVVPAGFVFDVSIPTWLRWLFNPATRQYFKAAALHDHMLISGWDRIVAGATFHQALAADGVSRWRRLAMWLAVSLWKYR